MQEALAARDAAGRAEDFATSKYKHYANEDTLDRNAPDASRETTSSQHMEGEEEEQEEQQQQEPPPPQQQPQPPPQQQQQQTEKEVAVEQEAEEESLGTAQLHLITSCNNATGMRVCVCVCARACVRVWCVCARCCCNLTHPLVLRLRWSLVFNSSRRG